MNYKHPGWEDGGCCCNCKHQLIITNHPFNFTIGKGPISTNLGYGCKGMLELEKHESINLDKPPKITFMDDSHGYCELWAGTIEGVNTVKNYYAAKKFKLL